MRQERGSTWLHVACAAAVLGLVAVDVVLTLRWVAVVDETRRSPTDVVMPLLQYEQAIRATRENAYDAGYFDGYTDGVNGSERRK